MYLEGTYYTDITSLPSNSNSISVNPVFLNFVDLHILNTSSQTNVANPDIPTLFPYDIDGEPRPDNVTQLPDIGADEYTPIVAHQEVICFTIGETIMLSLPDSLSSPQWIQITNDSINIVSTSNEISIVPTLNSSIYVGLGEGANDTYAFIYTLQANYNGTQNVTICSGQTYILPNGEAVNNSGTYPVHLLSTQGCDSTITTILDMSPCVSVRLRAYLEGAYNASNSNMNTTAASILPLQQPYNTAPWNYTGIESVATIPTGAVDWVLVEARAADNPSVVIQRTVAWLLNNGNIVDYQNTAQGIYFDGLNSGSNYLFAIRHRNHLAVMSRLPITVTNVAHTTTDYDFTTAATQVAGANQLKMVGFNTYALLAGDIDGNGIIDAFNDFNKYQTTNGVGYKLADLNLNGLPDSGDFNLWLSNVGKPGIVELR